METPETKPQTSVFSPAPPSSVTRLWRPAAQRNLRNQWSKLTSHRKDWISSSSAGRTHATSLVNAYLSQKYLPLMELGVLSEMSNIRKKASFKLFKQQELHRNRLLSSYKDMVLVVKHMVDVGKTMRCYLKGTSGSPLVQFSSSSEDSSNDSGDGGGIPVFAFWSVSSFEKLAEELVQMFEMEVSLKRLLILDLLSLSCEAQQANEVCWSDELYPGEFSDLAACNLYSEYNSEPVRPQCKDTEPDARAVPCNNEPDQESLQVKLTTWIAEVNIDAHRVDEIFAIVGEEMHVPLS